jgi:hypothetical protein
MIETLRGAVPGDWKRPPLSQAGAPGLQQQATALADLHSISPMEGKPCVPVSHHGSSTALGTKRFGRLGSGGSVRTGASGYECVQRYCVECCMVQQCSAYRPNRVHSGKLNKWCAGAINAQQGGNEA